MRRLAPALGTVRLQCAHAPRVPHRPGRLPARRVLRRPRACRARAPASIACDRARGPRARGRIDPHHAPGRAARRGGGDPRRDHRRGGQRGGGAGLGGPGHEGRRAPRPHGHAGPRGRALPPLRAGRGARVAFAARARQRGRRGAGGGRGRARARAGRVDRGPWLGPEPLDAGGVPGPCPARRRRAREPRGAGAHRRTRALAQRRGARGGGHRQGHAGSRRWEDPARRGGRADRRARRPGDGARRVEDPGRAGRGAGAAHHARSGARVVAGPDGRARDGHRGRDGERLPGARGGGEAAAPRVRLSPWSGPRGLAPAAQARRRSGRHCDVRAARREALRRRRPGIARGRAPRAVRRRPGQRRPRGHAAGRARPRVEDRRAGRLPGRGPRHRRPGQPRRARRLRRGRVQPAAGPALPRGARAGARPRGRAALRRARRGRLDAAHARDQRHALGRGAPRAAADSAARTRGGPSCRPARTWRSAPISRWRRSRRSSACTPR